MTLPSIFDALFEEYAACPPRIARLVALERGFGCCAVCEEIIEAHHLIRFSSRTDRVAHETCIDIRNEIAAN